MFILYRTLLYHSKKYTTLIYHTSLTHSILYQKDPHVYVVFWAPMVNRHQPEKVLCLRKALLAITSDLAPGAGMLYICTYIYMYTYVYI